MSMQSGVSIQATPLGAIAPAATEISIDPPHSTRDSSTTLREYGQNFHPNGCFQRLLKRLTL
jgi:hypothetical protein